MTHFAPLRTSVMPRFGAFAVTVALLSPTFPATAQLIPVRVLPIAEADQFAFHPSANFGMANVSIALPDSLLDPFRNPALGSRIRRGLYYGAPTFFSVTNDAGSGQTLPVGGFARLGRTFVGGAIAVQEINPARSRSQPFFGPLVALESSVAPPGINPAPNETQNNSYVEGTIGHTLASRWSIGASGSWSDLRALEGMELRFPGSHNLRQSGHRSEVRLGVHRDWARQSFEAVAVRSQLDMDYQAGYAHAFWDPATRQQRLSVQQTASRETSRAAGLELRYDRALRDSSWRAGAIATVNRSRERGASFYEFMGIPQDPSRTVALNLGLGISRRTEPVTFAFDAIYEPAWRRSVGAVDTLSLASTGLVAPGTASDEGYFKFQNVVLRGGIGRDILMTGSDSRLRLQFGMQMRSVNYTLEQHDFLTGVYRERDNSWREWIHAWGANFIFPRFEFGYQLRLLSGMGRFGVPPDDMVFAVPDIALQPAIPGGTTSITLYPVRVASHQMFFSVPIR